MRLQHLKNRRRKEINCLHVFGLASAIKKNFPIKHCEFCRKYHDGERGCRLWITKEVVDEQTGKECHAIVSQDRMFTIAPDKIDLQNHQFISNIVRKSLKILCQFY